MSFVKLVFSGLLWVFPSVLASVAIASAAKKATLGKIFTQPPSGKPTKHYIRVSWNMVLL